MSDSRPAVAKARRALEVLDEAIVAERDGKGPSAPFFYTELWHARDALVAALELVKQPPVSAPAAEVLR